MKDGEDKGDMIFNIVLVRSEWSYRVVTVASFSKEAAEKRALVIGKSPAPRLKREEEIGDWCDTLEGTVVVRDREPPIPQRVRAYANKLATDAWGTSSKNEGYRVAVRDAYLAGWIDAQDPDVVNDPGAARAAFDSAL